MTEKRNWHAIIGPNGMCECGTEHTCGGLFQEEILAVYEQAAVQLENMAFSIERICQEPDVSDATRELGKIRCEALRDGALAIRSR